MTEEVEEEMGKLSEVMKKMTESSLLVFFLFPLLCVNHAILQ